MTTTATTVELFRNLAQYEYDGKYYDFHNEYDCHRIEFIRGVLLLSFKHIGTAQNIFLKFDHAEIITFNLWSNVDDKIMTIDNIYRGRMESKGKLMEISDDGKAYFYLEFYEGQRIEFWADTIDVEEGEVS